jgi:hypothetical protein
MSKTIDNKKKNQTITISRIGKSMHDPVPIPLLVEPIQPWRGLSEEEKTKSMKIAIIPI